jgi:hypothetical protein
MTNKRKELNTMLEINDKQKFEREIKDALIKSANFPRWQNAIKKAVVQIEMNKDFMTFDAQEAYLLIWSQGSNQIYTANGVCQCKAFEQGQPCWHRAAARLVRNYFGLEENKAPVAMEKAPYLKPSSNRKPTIIGGCRV